MTPTIRTYIARSIFLPFTAEEVAFCTNDKFKLRGSEMVRTVYVERMWSEMAESNVAVRELIKKFGTRPDAGWPSSEELKLAERLVAA